ncbi:hypothetical protein LCGC14_1167650 [marine sediment metagenome]|uniref:VRR-NUC domain-containing protein n=1 Tax=marine sediment metagenome TaxID=412755 RepID=A0A0F9P8U7_9ZZZZ
MPRRYHTLELTERQWQAQIVKAAEAVGWLCYHTYDSRRSQKGFPDLVLVKAPVIIFAELKVKPADVKAGKLTLEQDTWVRALAECSNLNLKVFVWRPNDWPEVERVLKGESRVREEIA